MSDTKLTVDLLKTVTEKFIVTLEADDNFLFEIAPATKASYIRAARNLASELSPYPSDNVVTPSGAQDLINAVRRSRGPGAAKMVKSIVSVILRYMSIHTTMGYVTFNPFSLVETGETGHIKAWTFSEAEEMIGLRHVSKRKTEFISALTCVLYDTAQRLSDAVDFSLDACVNREWRLIQKKTSELVSVPVSIRLADVSIYLEEKSRTMNTICYGKTISLAAYVNGLIKDPNIVLGEYQVRHLFRKECDRLGLELPPLHGLRKAAINRMIDAGATVHEIMSVTGHRKSSTLDIYTDEMDRVSAARRAVEKLKDKYAA